ncbi:hypothetical protein GQX74_014344 [Glossina fuscipes]|nr:hypothetical protein GQX74_014344 [Glossina fuscipes]
MKSKIKRKNKSSNQVGTGFPRFMTRAIKKQLYRMNTKIYGYEITVKVKTQLFLSPPKPLAVLVIIV